MKIYLKEFKDDQVSQTLETLKPTFGSLVKSLKLKSVYDESLSILSNFPNIEELDLITYPSLNWGETINVDFNGKYPVFERLKVLMITSSYLVMERLLNLTKDIETFFFENDHQTDHENDDKILKYFDQHKNLKYFTINESDGLTNRFTDDALAQFINSHDQLIELDIVICKLDFSFISKLKEHKNLKKLKIESKSTDIANIYLNEKLWNLRSLFIGDLKFVEESFWKSIDENCPLLNDLTLIFLDYGSHYVQKMILNGEFPNLQNLYLSDIKNEEMEKIRTKRPHLFKEDL